MRGAQAKLYFPSGTWNEAGHELAARRIARGLCAPAAPSGTVP